MTRTIELTRGMVAIVDDESYDAIVARGKWIAHRKGDLCYATRRESIPGVKNRVKSTRTAMHRIVLGMTDDDKRDVDHVNGNGLDNRKENLRPCTPSQNGANRKRNANNKSGYKGVRKKAGDNKWTATLTYQQKKIHIGRFFSAKDAATAYDNKARELFGPFARPNFST